MALYSYGLHEAVRQHGERRLAKDVPVADGHADGRDAALGEPLEVGLGHLLP